MCSENGKWSYNVGIRLFFLVLVCTTRRVSLQNKVNFPTENPRDTSEVKFWISNQESNKKIVKTKQEIEKRTIFEKSCEIAAGTRKTVAKSYSLSAKNCHQKTQKKPVNFPTETLWKILTKSEVKFSISSQKISWNKITSKR